MFGFPFLTSLVVAVAGIAVVSLVWNRGTKLKKSENSELTEKSE